MKVIEELFEYARQYAPSLIAHILFFVWLSFVVVDIDAVQESNDLLEQYVANANNVLDTLQLPTQRWYIALGLVLAYLTSFRWLGSFLASLPVLRIIYHERFDREVVVSAREIWEEKPNVWKIEERLFDLVYPGGRHSNAEGSDKPYFWLQNRKSVMHSYYNAVLVAFVFSVGYAIVLPNVFIKSPNSIWLTLAALFALIVLLRWYIRKLNTDWLNLTAMAKLREIERAPKTEDWSLAYDLNNVTRSIYRQFKGQRRHPASILSDLLSPLPENWQRRLNDRLNLPGIEVNEDWKLMISSRMRRSDEQPVVAAHLDASDYEDRFKALLERKGTGLFLLVPPDSDQALAAPDFGATYSFEDREHGFSKFQLRLHSRGGVLSTSSHPELEISSHGGDSFLSPPIDLSIADLIVGNRPEPYDAWQDLTRAKRSFDVPLPGFERDQPKAKPIKTGSEQPVKFGQSYIAGIKTKNDTDVRIAFQCFNIEGRNQLLIAWAFLDISTPVLDLETMTIGKKETPLPWWNPRAWRNLIKPADSIF